MSAVNIVDVRSVTLIAFNPISEHVSATKKAHELNEA